MDIITQVKWKLEILMGEVQVGGHNLDHFFAVHEHAKKALACQKLSDHQKLQVELAALLHDVDDRKIFPNSVNYKNARSILLDIEIANKETFIEEIIDMIDLVSCSKNNENFTLPLENQWMFIPRDCDRLEAIGDIGIQRCAEFTYHKGTPRSVESTPRATTAAGVMALATPERFAAYTRGQPSVSMIDHYYDKLLHIGQPQHLKSQNPYILKEAEARHAVMLAFVVSYWAGIYSFDV